MNPRTIILSLAGLWMAAALQAQSDNGFGQYVQQQREAFERDYSQRQKEFDDYRRRCNEEFAQHLRKAWIARPSSPKVPLPKDEVVPPVIKREGSTSPTPQPRPLPYNEVVTVPKPQPQPKPVVPIATVPVEQSRSVTFTFFGTEERVRTGTGKPIRLSAVSENGVADCWLELSGQQYTNMVYDCLKIRKERKLCDWAYLTMLQCMAEAVCGKATNEATLLTAYVYCQSGYRMRLAIRGGRLEMMFASAHTIYGWDYYLLDGEKYYPLGRQGGEVRICAQRYPKEQALSLTVNEEQVLAVRPTATVARQSKVDREMSVTVSANQNMLDFYSSYPTSMANDNFMTRWAMYANCPLDRRIKEQVYPGIRRAIAGCDQLTAANRILNFVQTAFVYEYDDKVWGRDRAFFPEESLFYPYCDCEDRSILLTRLVRDLLHLPCLLVFYPGHLAAAIAFTEVSPTGDYIAYGGRKYFIADGTILYGVPVGVTMRDMDNKTAKIIPLD